MVHCSDYISASPSCKGALRGADCTCVAAVPSRGQTPAFWLATLDWAIQQALANRLLIILDFHEFHAMGDDPLANKERFLAAWRQIADRYKDQPNEMLFEILNEPIRDALIPPQK